LFTLQPIGSIDYYINGDESDRLGYYFGGTTSADEIPATWWLPHKLSDKGRGVFAPVSANATVDPELLTALANGHLGSAGSVQDSFRARKVGYDLQFAPPKSVSLLFAFADLATKLKVLDAHLKATTRTLEFVSDTGLIQSRRGKAGTVREAVLGFVSALFTHFSSRDDDPQLHTHVVVPNTVLRKDGSVGTFDTKTLYQWQLAIGAIYTAELSSNLRALGYDLEPTEHAFEIAGVPTEVLRNFSKRRNAIEEYVGANGFTTGQNRAAAQVAALKTRKAKSGLPIAELRRLWQEQLAEMGIDAGDLVTRTEPQDPPVAPDIWPLAKMAIQAAMEHDATLSRASVFKIVGMALQCFASASEIEHIADRLVQEKVLVKLTDASLPEETYYSTPQVIDAERAIVSLAKMGVGCRQFVPREAIEAVIEKRSTMSQEQIDAARHALNLDQVSIVEGTAGSGKSFTLGAVAEASRNAGLDVWALGPSWRAARVLGEDTNAPKTRVRALTGFLNDLERGKVVLTADTVLLCDEAGMVDTPQMHRLMEAAARGRCKLVLSGDTRQLTPVGPGSPMALLTRTIGTCRIEQIRRQKTGWNRAASMGFARGRAHLALRAYDVGGRISWMAGSDATLVALADQFIKDRQVDVAKAGAGHLPTCQAFAGRNAVVHRLNQLIRSRLQAAGLVGADAFVLEVLSGTTDRRNRGENKQILRPLALGLGDRIVFKEKIDHPQRLIQNAETAIVEQVVGGPSPSLVLRFEPDGSRVRTRVDELVGFREEGAPQVPAIALAYAGTTYFGQGLTLDRAYVAATHAMSAEHIYVAMTRHRHSARLFVDVDRINVRARDVPSSPIAKFGGGKLEKDARAIELLEEKKKRFYQECRRPTAKRNALDLLVEPKPASQGAAETHYTAAKNGMLAILGEVAPSSFKQITRYVRSIGVLNALRLAISKFWKNPFTNGGFGLGRRETITPHHKSEFVKGGEISVGSGKTRDSSRRNNDERSALHISPD
jgi:conjugative relaxase-like TrwC/TraI family protein